MYTTDDQLTPSTSRNTARASMVQSRDPRQRTPRAWRGNPWRDADNPRSAYPPSIVEDILCRSGERLRLPLPDLIARPARGHHGPIHRERFPHSRARAFEARGWLQQSGQQRHPHRHLQGPCRDRSPPSPAECDTSHTQVRTTTTRTPSVPSVSCLLSVKSASNRRALCRRHQPHHPTNGGSRSE